MQEDRILELERMIGELTSERDALVSLAEAYDGTISRLSSAYAMATSRLERSLELSTALTEQYREIAKDRAESITNLLHGGKTVVGNTLRGHESESDQSPLGKVGALIARKEQRLSAAIRKPSFFVARAVTGFTDGSFDKVNSQDSPNMSYENRVEYLAELDRAMERLTNSRAYRLRSRLKKAMGKILNTNVGKPKS